jgi:hypothetical protein
VVAVAVSFGGADRDGNNTRLSGRCLRVLAYEPRLVRSGVIAELVGTALFAGGRWASPGSRLDETRNVSCSRKPTPAAGTTRRTGARGPCVGLVICVRIAALVC